MTLKLVTGLTENYTNRARPYFDTLKEYADFPITVVGVGFTPQVDDYGFTAVPITGEENAGAPERTYCIQHGSFLKVTKGRVTDVWLYTDGDFIMQRPMDSEEKEFLNLSHGQVAVNWNGGSHETLAFEATRLRGKTTFDKLLMDWGAWIRDKPIYNVGAIAMTRKTWQEVYDYYMERWAKVGEYFDHEARQQWLVSYAISALELDVKIMPWSLHAHGHFGLKPGMERRDDGIYADGKKALFRHFL